MSASDQGLGPSSASGAGTAALVRAFDWTQTSLGAPETWPKSLVGYVSMILAMPTPAIIFWGPDQIQIYNDGYAAIMGPRHPRYFGAPYRECWPDTYPVIYPWMQKVLERGETIQVEDELFTLTRHRFTEEAYFTFTFSPLRDDAGAIAGIFQPVVEVTRAVLGERRGATLRALGPRVGSGDSMRDAFGTLAENLEDVAFAVMLSPGPAWSVTASCGLDPSALRGPVEPALAEIARRVFESGAPLQVDDVEGQLGVRHVGTWGDPTRSAWALPVRRAPSEAPRGVVLFGLSARLQFDDAYRAFLEGAARELAVNLIVEEARRADLAARHRLQSLFQSAPAIVCALRGPDHVYELANPPHQRLTGRDRDVVGLPVREALPEMAAQGIVALLDEVYRTGEAYVGREVPVKFDRRGDGVLDEAYLTFVYQPRRSAQGTVEGIDVFGFDVTDHVLARRRAEALAEQLRENEERLRMALAAAGAGTFDVDLDTGEAHFDARMRQLCNLAPDEPLDQGRCLAQVHPDDRGFVDEAFRRAVADGHPYYVEHRIVGEAERWVAARGHTFRDAQGRALRLVGTGLDITARKDAERALRERAEFEQQLIGIVSHDLKTPLHAIALGVTTLSRKEDLDDRTTKALVRIQASAHRAARLVQDLLDFTQARLGGGIPVSPAPLDLHAFTRGVVEEVRASHPDRDVALETEGDGRGAFDQDRMAQVLSNLLSNALQYSDAGSTVLVRVRGAGDLVELEVHNEGPPIPPEARERLFQPLARLGTAQRDRAGRSVGLGLYIVKQIVNAHAGSIALTSSPERGTTFTVRLPRAAGEAAGA